MSLPLLLDMAVASHGDRAVVGPLDAPVTVDELAARARVAAARFKASGRPNVAFFGRNGEGFVVALLGAALAGIPFSPLSYRLGAEQLDGLMKRLEGPIVVADADLRDQVSALAGAVVVTDEVADGAEGEVDFVDEDSTAVLLFTSGTTGDPKGVVLTHNNLFSYVSSTVELGGAAPTDAALICVPPYHVAAIGNTLTNLYSGRRMIHLPDFEPGRWLELVRAGGVTSAMVVPTMLARIVDHLGGQPAETPTLATIAYGGSRMPLTVLEKALVAFPQAGFVNAYGLTETSSTITVLGPDDHREALSSDDPAIRRRLESAGRPVPSVELQVRDAEGTVLGPDEPGDLWARGPQISGTYLGLGSVLDENGWFPTHDRASMDSEGFLFIEGRSDDTIIRGSENIAPAEIEEVLLRHPAIADAVVLGVPDEEWGQQIAAVVVAKEPVTDEDLKAWVRERLRSSRTPSTVLFRDELPRTDTGKVLKRVLMADLSGQAAAR
jgi:acyl-CoA synthetase (AMP-forming)/AMP-acid ligase II